MPALPWATEAQLRFLNSKRVNFATAQLERRLAAFWPVVYGEFFAQWPDQAAEIASAAEDSGSKSKKKKASAATTEPIAATEEEWTQKRKTNIYHWFNNHGLHKGRRAGKVNTVKITAASSSSRVSSLAHLYSKKYYETRVKEQVDKEITGRNIDEGQRLTIVNKHISRAFENETPDVKEEIRKMQEEEKRARDAAKNIEKHVANGELLTAEQLLLGQSTLPDVIQDFCEAMNERSGWWFTVLAGGPDPSQNGAIRTYSICTGKDSYERSFARAYPEFNDGILRPFSSFMQTVFSNDAREKFKLNKAKDGTTSTGSMGSASPEMSSQHLDGNVSTNQAENNETDTESMEAMIVEAAPTAIANQPLPSPPDTLPIAAATGVETSATALNNPSVPIDSEPRHTISGIIIPPTNILQPQPCQQLVQQTVPLQPPLQSTPPEMTIPPFESQLINPEWNGMNGYGYAPIGPGYNFGLQTFGGDFGGQAGLGPLQGFNMLTGTTYDAWQVAQNPAGNLDSEMNDPINWNFGPPFTAGETNIPRPTDHRLPSSPAKEDRQIPTQPLPTAPVPEALDQQNESAAAPIPEALDQQNESAAAPIPEAVNQQNESMAVVATIVKETRIRKPAARKEVVPLTETVNKDNSLPEWMSLALQYLNDGVEREEWLRCVDAWSEFETLVIGLQNSTSHRLSAKDRPELLTKWLQSRKYQAIPNVPDKALFGSSWRTWWNGIQPKWRQVSKEGALPAPLSAAKDSSSLNVLKKGGISGFITVLIGLKWWVPPRGDIDTVWAAAVEDVTSCLKVMTNASGGTKRKRSNEEHKPERKRKKT